MSDPQLVEREVVIAVMAAIEEETIKRCAAACRAYAAQHAKPGSRIATARAGAGGHLAKIIEQLERKSK